MYEHHDHKSTYSHRPGLFKQLSVWTYRGRSPAKYKEVTIRYSVSVELTATFLRWWKKLINYTQFLTTQNFLLED